MNTVLLTGYREDFAWMGARTKQGKEWYAEKYGLSFKCNVDYPEEFGLPSWQKLRLIKELFQQGYDAVLWLDADAVITNQFIDIMTLIKTLHNIDGQKCLYASTDWGNHPIDQPYSNFSMGNFVWMNTTRGNELLDLASSLLKYSRAVYEQDQGAVREVLKTVPHTRYYINILNRRILNAVPAFVQPLALDPWAEGDFLAHLTSVDKDLRVAALSRLNVHNE